MWKKVIDTNLKGPFICMREVYKHMSEGGKVINLGSVSGQYGGPRTTCACASVYYGIDPLLCKICGSEEEYIS